MLFPMASFDRDSLKQKIAQLAMYPGANVLWASGGRPG
jgi:hypothetical protein